MATVSGGTTSERFGFIHRFGKKLGVRYLCDWLNLSPSGYYAWRLRGLSNKVNDDIKLSQLVRREYEKSRGTYGSPRVFEVLKWLGIHTSRKRVERLMREAGLRARAIKHYRNSAALHRYFMNIPNRRLVLPKPKQLNQHWVAGLTYLKVGKQWRYLATVMDLYSRRIIGWSLSNRKNAELTIVALKMAIRKRDIKPGVIFHTDRGTEFRSYHVQDVLKQNGIIPSTSMSRPYDSIDNAEMESFYKTLKSDLIRGNKYSNEGEFRKGLKGYINHFYNTQRLHSSL